MARDGRRLSSYAALMRVTNRVYSGVILAKLDWFGTEGSEVRILSPRPNFGPLLTVMVGRGPLYFQVRLKRGDNLGAAQAIAPEVGRDGRPCHGGDRGFRPLGLMQFLCWAVHLTVGSTESAAEPCEGRRLPVVVVHPGFVKRDWRRRGHRRDGVDHDRCTKRWT